jgi:maltooligosyltrehalose trehalohydrolase
MNWIPSIGAWPQNGATRFRVWAPEARRIDLVLENAAGRDLRVPLERFPDGYFQTALSDVKPGDLYRYQVDGQGPFPDPASRFQPSGVHGPSRVVDPGSFRWSDVGWRGVALEDLVLYELHVGAFTPSGTFAAASERLPWLRDLGVTAVELMPVADFPGARNWGYDGVSLFAPARCYGGPDELRRFVDDAHRIGLAVHLDVVYNHLGPDGAYHGVYSPHYVSRTHPSPWGDALNFDGPHSGPVRDFFIENALHWVHEYHIDGLRLDATHAIVDASPRHFLAELSSRVHDSIADGRRTVILAAEDVRNLAHMVLPVTEGGWGLDAVWSDDFHHQMRRCLAGDRDGYFGDFSGAAVDIAATARLGWFYRGQQAPYFGGPRGTDPEGIHPSRFVFFLQNHDQVGNRSFGDRLHHAGGHGIDLAAYRAATALLLLLPQTPLLFMGQEWAATSPFQFFTDHSPGLGVKVTEGRRNEFSRFEAFSDPRNRAAIPDPQDVNTFLRSRLRWEEMRNEPHAAIHRFYRKLLSLRREHPALCPQHSAGFAIASSDEDTVLLRRDSASSDALLLIVRLRGAGPVNLGENLLSMTRANRQWSLLLSSEDAIFASDSAPPEVNIPGMVADFARPGAVVLRSESFAPEGG